MSQLTDFLMIGMMGVGGLFIFFNWKDVQKCLNDFEGCLGGGSGTTGNCTYNAGKGEFTWTGNHTVCQAGKTVVVNDSVSATCKRTDGSTCTKDDGCVLARDAFLKKLPNKPCTGTPPPTGCTKVCTGGFKKVNSPCSCSCNPTLQKCNAAQVTQISGSGASATCKCINCNVGFKRGGSNGNTCVPQGGNVSCQPCYVSSNGVCKYNPGSGAAWIARVANAMLSRMLARPSNVPTISQIASGWPSLTTELAVKYNACSLSKLRTSNSLFNKGFAQLLSAIVFSYKLPLTLAAQSAMILQQNTGIWQLNTWAGGVPGYYTKAMPSQIRGDTPYGRAYSPTLQGRENRYDPFGNQKYSFTLPKEGMKVKVAN